MSCAQKDRNARGVNVIKTNRKKAKTIVPVIANMIPDEAPSQIGGT